MGKKGKKTRWRRLPIGGTDEESGLSLEAPGPPADPHRVTFNEDEYTKITTPRQDVLFKKGYFGRKRTPPNPSPTEAQDVHSGADSVENESYIGEECQYAYPAGYMDPTSGVYYVNGNTFETYDPYTGTVTVVVGPPAQYAGGPPVLAALPCQPVPLQPVEWFNPAAPWCYSYNRRKRYSTDSQNCSAQSSESTGPPGSPQEPMDEAAGPVMYPAALPPQPQPQYVYPGYMFGPPIYNMNGMTVQGMMPQPVPLPPDSAVSKRRKKRRRRRRGGVTDDGSESSCCEEPLTCDVTGCQMSETSQSGASSDAGVGPNSDSGINTNSGSNSPPLEAAEETQHHFNGIADSLCSNSEQVAALHVAAEVSEDLAEDDVTPNLCASAPEFSSQESTLSCLSTPSAARDLLQEVSFDVSHEELSVSCHVVNSLCESVAGNEGKYVQEDSPSHGSQNEFSPLLSSEPQPENPDHDLITCSEDDQIDEDVNECLCEPEITLVKAINSVSLKNEFMEDDPVLDIEINEPSTDSINCEILEVTSGKSPELTESNTREETQINPSTISQEDQEQKTENEIMVCKSGEVTLINQEEVLNELGDSPSDENNKVTTIQEEEEIKKDVTEPLLIRQSTTNLNTEITHLDTSRLSSGGKMLAPVPPPRRKKSMNRAADKIAARVVEEAIRLGIEEAARVRLKSTLSITEAVTRWLNSHESSPLTYPADEESDNDDEGIEVEEEELTGQKNVRGNPFLASSLSDAGQRVAIDCESLSSAGEWDMWDHSHTRDMCDPTRSVDKYYRLGADEGVPPSVYKTAMHIRHTGPFPCGVCCIIQ